MSHSATKPKTPGLSNRQAALPILAAAQFRLRAIRTALTFSVKLNEIQALDDAVKTLHEALPLWTHQVDPSSGPIKWTRQIEQLGERR